MTKTVFIATYTKGPSPEEMKLNRRTSHRAGLFAPELLRAAFTQSFVMLRPDNQWKNPVMFVVEVGTVLTLIITVATVFGYQSQARLTYLIALDVWLFLTVMFANFATSLAEARGKAQADTLRKTRRETPAFRLNEFGSVEATSSTSLRRRPGRGRGGQVIPAMAKSSRALPPSMSRPSPANRRRSSAKPAATAPASPAARACSPIGSSSRLPPGPGKRFSTA